MEATSLQENVGSTDTPSDCTTVDPRIARSRASLLEAATELLIEGGARAVTVDAVAERSGVAKSTLYRHFPSRTDLLVHVMRHNMPHTDDTLPDGDFETTLRTLVRQVATSMGSDEWSRIFPAMAALKLTMPELQELTETDREAKVAVAQAALDRGVAEGVLPAGIDAHDVVPMLIGPLMFAVINHETDRLLELADRTVDQFLAAHRTG